MRFEDDPECNMTSEGKKGLASTLLSIVCCRRCCEGVCFWRTGSEAKKQRKDVLDYVTDERLQYQRNGRGGSRHDRQHTEDAEEEDEDGGYDNEGCTERRERRMTITDNGRAEKDMVSELYHRIEARRSNSISVTPLVDWKAVEFWAAGTGSAVNHHNHYQRPEAVQPRREPPTNSIRSLSSPSSCVVHGFCPQLYEAEVQPPAASERDREMLTDDQKLEKYRLGQLRFGVRYDTGSRALLVSVLAGRDLAPPLQRDASRNDLARSNPYVRVCLLPDRKGSQQTTVQRKTQSPTFEQTFTFDMPYVEAQKRTLQLKVSDFDKYSRHCVLGQVLLPLANVNLVKGRPMWKPLVPCDKEQQDLGDIFVSLNYLPSAGRLNVDVIEAKQLLLTDLDSGSAPFVRVCLVVNQKASKQKRTSCKKDATSPTFNESFSFQVTTTSLDDASVVVSAWRRGGGALAKDAFVGRVVLGKKEATGPEERAHWSRVVRAHRKPVAHWHTLRSRRDCDALSLASKLVP